MDCGGLRAVLKLRAALHDANRRLVVVCPPGPVLRLLVVTGVDRELEIHPTRTGALS
jgi:anti-anti-sigma factor